jgi:hypothetical protein
MSKLSRREFKTLVLEWNSLLVESRVYKLKEIVSLMEKDDSYTVSDIAIFERFWRQSTYVSKYSHCIYNAIGITTITNLIRIIREHYNRIYQSAGPALKSDIGSGKTSLLDLLTDLEKLEKIQSSKVLSVLLDKFNFNKTFKNRQDFDVLLSDSEFVVCRPNSTRGSIALGRSYWCKHSNKLKYDLKFNDGYGPKSGGMSWCTTIVNNRNFTNYSDQMTLIYFIKKNYSPTDNLRKVCISLPKAVVNSDDEDDIEEFINNTGIDKDFVYKNVEDFYEDENIDIYHSNVDGNNDPIVDDSNSGNVIIKEIESIVGKSRYRYLLSNCIPSLNEFNLRNKLIVDINEFKEEVTRYHRFADMNHNKELLYDEYLEKMLSTEHWKEVINLLINKNKGVIRNRVAHSIFKRLSKLHDEINKNFTVDQYNLLINKFLDLCEEYRSLRNIYNYQILLNKGNVSNTIFYRIFLLYMSNNPKNNVIDDELFFRLYIKDERSTSDILEHILDVRSHESRKTNIHRRGFVRDDFISLLKHRNCSESILIKIIKKYHVIFNYYNLSLNLHSYEDVAYYGKEDKEISNLIKNSQGYTDKIRKQVVKNNTALSKLFGIIFNVSTRFLGKQLAKGFNYLERYLDNRDKEKQKALEDKWNKMPDR